MAVRLSTLRASPPISRRRFLALISVRGWVDPRAIRIRSIEKYNDLIGNRTRDLPGCSTAPQPTTLPRAPRPTCTKQNSNNYGWEAQDDKESWKRIINKVDGVSKLGYVWIIFRFESFFYKQARIKRPVETNRNHKPIIPLTSIFRRFTAQYAEPGNDRATSSNPFWYINIWS
jgi:hypothetical protein